MIQEEVGEGTDTVELVQQSLMELEQGLAAALSNSETGAKCSHLVETNATLRRLILMR